MLALLGLLAGCAPTSPEERAALSGQGKESILQADMGSGVTCYWVAYNMTDTFNCLVVPR